MSNENQIGTLEEMSKESFINRPQEAVDATNEYLSNLKEENPIKASILEEKLKKNGKFLEQFKVAITHTSLMVFLTSVKASNFAFEIISSENEDGIQDETQYILSQIKVDFDKYIREFLLYSQQDDKEIYDMRMFYLEGLSGEELQLNQINDKMYDTKEEKVAAQRKANIQTQKYDELLNLLKKQYKDTKIYLLVE